MRDCNIIIFGFKVLNPKAIVQVIALPFIKTLNYGKFYLPIQ